MSKNNMIAPTKVIIPCRFAYFNGWEPQTIDGGELKYSVSAIIDKQDQVTLQKIQAAIECAKKAFIAKWGGPLPENFKLPLRDGDAERPEDEAYVQAYFLNANSKQAPQIVDKQVQPIEDTRSVYSGCYGRMSVTFYGYQTNGNCGIAAGLGNIQYLKAGAPLGNRVDACEEFDVVEIEDDLLA